MKIGKIVPHGVSLEKHENDTVVFFTNLGKTVELIPPSNTPCNRRPDFVMDGLEWEMKSPTGSSSRMTVERILHKAAKQSENIVIDLRRVRLSDEQSLRCLEKQFKLSRRIRRLLVITKQEEVVDFRK